MCKPDVQMLLTKAKLDSDDLFQAKIVALSSSC